jgi:hypothetical protein
MMEVSRFGLQVLLAPWDHLHIDVLTVVRSLLSEEAGDRDRIATAPTAEFEYP